MQILPLYVWMLLVCTIAALINTAYLGLVWPSVVLGVYTFVCVNMLYNAWRYKKQLESLDRDHNTGKRKGKRNPWDK